MNWIIFVKKIVLVVEVKPNNDLSLSHPSINDRKIEPLVYCITLVKPPKTKIDQVTITHQIVMTSLIFERIVKIKHEMVVVINFLVIFPPIETKRSVNSRKTFVHFVTPIIVEKNLTITT